MTAKTIRTIEGNTATIINGVRFTYLWNLHLTYVCQTVDGVEYVSTIDWERV